MKLYHHKTSGGAEYLFDTFIKCKNKHKEGVINDKTKYVVRIDGDITKDAELNVREEKNQEEKKLIKAVEQVIDYLYADEQKNYEECEPNSQWRRKHIFKSIKILDKWLKTKISY